MYHHAPHPAVAVSKAAATPRDLTREIYVCVTRVVPFPPTYCLLLIYFALHEATGVEGHSGPQILDTSGSVAVPLIHTVVHFMGPFW